MYDLSFSYISFIFLPFFFFLIWLNCYDFVNNVLQADVGALS